MFLISVPLNAIALGTETQSTTSWKTGKAFQQSRRRAFSISWEAAPLRDRIEQLARQQGISVILDRRIDPRTPINLTASNVTMEQLLLQLCDQLGLGFCRVGDCFYLGPKPAADRLLVSSATTSPKGRNVSTALLKKSALNWPQLSTPAEALNSFTTETHLKLENADLLPHDSMAALDAPPLTLDQRLRLLLSQFELDYELKQNGKALALRRQSTIPAKGTARFTDVELSLAQYKAIKAKASNCRTRRNKKSITVTGPVDELVMVRNLILKSFSPPVSSAGQQQFTLKVTSRRSAILSAIGKQLQMPVDTALADPATMAEVVSLSVTNVSLQELLDRLVAGTNATCIATDSKIVVGLR